MSLDERVKGALERSSNIVDPDLRRDLSVVRRKTRRAAIRQRVGTGVILLTIAAAAVLVGPNVLDVIESQRHEPAVPPSTPVLLGSYRADLTGVPALGSMDLAGPWQLTLGGEGSLLWGAPKASGLREDNPRDTYDASGSTFVTNMFARDLCQGAGTGMYTFRLSAGSLRFDVVDDACDVRATVLTSVVWTST